VHRTGSVLSVCVRLQIRRVSKTTKGGRHPSVSVFVVVGNGNGAAGYALGKGENVGDATLKASLRAVKRMQAFNRCGDRTLPHRIEQKMGATRVHLWPLPAGALLPRLRVYARVCVCWD
jgi:small subunit ribosomal protein S5